MKNNAVRGTNVIKLSQMVINGENTKNAYMAGLYNGEPYVSGEQPGPGVVKLNTNENPYPPSPKVSEALGTAEVPKMRLYPDGDSAGLREAIAEILGVGTENVFAGNGSDEVLALAYQAFFSGKDNILTPDISYGFYPVWGDIYSVDSKILPLKDDFTIDVSAYRDSNGVIIANPNAPTGIALSLPDVEEIVRSNPNGVVIIDEAYIDFAGIESAIKLIGKYDNLLVVRTFSKSYSLAGLRVGFAVGEKSLISALRMMKDAFNSYPLGYLAQTVGKVAILDVEHWECTRKKIMATRDETAARLREMGFCVLDSQSNFLFVETEDAKEMYDYLYANNILVRYWDRPRINRFLRVTIGTDAEMEAFLECIGKRTRLK